MKIGEEKEEPGTSRLQMKKLTCLGRLWWKRGERRGSWKMEDRTKGGGRDVRV